MFMRNPDDNEHVSQFELRKRLILLRLRELFHVKQSERELDDELRYDIERRIEANLAVGMTAKEAEMAAKREFGSVDLAKEECRDERGTRWIEELWQDLRFGLRMLRKNPGFTAIAILTLALGIGANTAIFSVVNGVLLNPLPYPDPDQLVSLSASKPNFPTGSISYPNFLDWKKENQSFSSMAVTRGYGFNLTGQGPAEVLNAEFVTADFFPMLGVNPVIGRTFSPSEDVIGVGDVVAISSSLWERKFGSSQSVLGKTITLDGMNYTIVGVIPAGFDLPLRSFRASDIYAPMAEWTNTALPVRSAGLGIHGIGRLKPGVSIERAREDMDSVTRHLAAIYPDVDKGTGATLIPLKEQVIGTVRPFLLLLLGAVGLVLLIACVNVANLLLARSTGRSREIAVRSALGAGMGRLLRQMLTESVLLALAGGALGLVIAGVGTHAALDVLPATLPRANEVRLDGRVLLFTILVSVCAGILFGLVPAIRTARRNVHESLKEGGRGGSGARHRVHGALAIVEMAMALVLLCGAGLLIRSLAALWNVNPGFQAENVLTFGMSMPPPMIKASPTAIRAALRDFDSKIAAIPGVEAEALSWGALPMGGEDDDTFWIEGQPKPASQNEGNWTLRYVVGPNYLSAMKIPLLAGRFFSERDDEHSERVAVVDDVLARKIFPKGDAIGNRINFGDSDSFQIIGIVGHVKQWGLDTDDQNSLRAETYLPMRQLSDNLMMLVPPGTGVVLRTNGRVPGLMDSVRHTSEQISKDEVISGVQTMDEIIEQSLAAKRFAMMLLGVFAMLALVLASIGLYGVIAYLVGQRTHEIGVRIALGAQPGDVLGWVLGQGARMALAGVAIGLAASVGLTRLLAKQSLLFGVSATDPLTFTAVAIVLMLVALAASWIPARRAMRVDPIVALRYE
ncbi:MAG: ABC transporter permease [Candidatus Acidiferrales bacterium]